MSLTKTNSTAFTNRTQNAPRVDHQTPENADGKQITITKPEKFGEKYAAPAIEFSDTLKMIP